METSKLESLHTALIDARAGYDKAIEEAEGAELATLFEETRKAHADAHADIHAALGAEGGDTDDSGSFMGTVHRAVIGVRSAVTGIDRDSLSSFADGEERILGSYDDAIAEQGEGRVADMLRFHQDRLRDVVGNMRRLETRD